MKEYNIFHQTISLLLSQKISFYQSRKIRQSLFALIAPDIAYTKVNISKLTNKQLLNIGVSEQKYEIIQQIINIQCDLLNYSEWIDQLKSIKGIGLWTIKCLKIIFNIDDNIFLSEDLWIRKRLSELIDSDKSLTIAESNKISQKFNNYKTLVSKLLWRIKPEGIIAIKNNQQLNGNHFI